MTAPEQPATQCDGHDRYAVDFIDILFALVVGEGLVILTRAGSMPGAGRAHLALAGALTILSWIGYHNSSNVEHGEIAFTRTLRSDGTRGSMTPLVKFLIDVVLVGIYWFAMETTEGGRDGSSLTTSLHPEAILVGGSMVLYALWDLASYFKSWRGLPYMHRRRMATLVCVALAAPLTIWGLVVDDPTTRIAVIYDVLLIVLLVAFRVFKEWMPPGLRSLAKA